MPEVPAWLTVASSLITLLVGNLLKPVFDFGAQRAENAAKAAERLRDDMLKYAAEVRAENKAIKAQNDELRRYYAQTANSLIDFRTFVLTEAGRAQYHHDRSEHEEVAKRLDSLIGGAQRLQLPLGGHNVPTETDAR